jgi:ribonuclease HI
MDGIQVWYDGCVEPVNPGGHGAIGVVIKQGGRILLEESLYLGHGPQMSNNVAEYSAMIAGMEHLIKTGLTDVSVIFYGDSLLSPSSK